MFLQNLFRKKKEVSPFLNTEYFHTDNEGLKWYEFKNKEQMPLTRLLAMQNYILVWNMNLDSTELNKLIDICEKCIEDGLSKEVSGKKINIIKLATALGEIKDRQEKIRIFELIADVLAVSFIRSDEDFYNFDNTKHLQKKQYILDLSKKKEPFFIETNIFKALSSYQIGSKEDFQILLEESEREKQARKIAIEYLNGKKPL